MSKEIIVLLPQTLLKEKTIIHCSLEFNEIAFSFEEGDSYFLHRFDFEEWDKFVNGINKADKKSKEIKEGGK